MESLLLFRRALASPTMCRFIPALSVPSMPASLQCLVLLASGSVAGLALGAAASRILASIVYQASASDPWVILAAVLTMARVGLISAAVPAWRVLSVDPTRLLRDE